MALKDRIYEDNTRVFMNHGHFAEWHTWNGKKFQAVTDEEEALKRRNNNVVDVSWDSNTREILLHVIKDEFPGVPESNLHGILDKKPMKILSVVENMGMIDILFAANETKEVY